LKYAALKICREGRRVFLPIVIWQWTVAVMPVAFAFDLDSEVPEHLFKVQSRPKLFEVNP
jgi:hypothetical protein